MIYLDYAATMPMRPEAVQAMLPYFTERAANAGALHSAGREARRAVDDARAAVARGLNADAAELFLNGCSLGKKPLAPADHGRAVWEIPFEPGRLHAVVSGAEDVLCTPGKACALKLLPDVNCLPADGERVAQTEVCLIDENGNIAAADDHTVYFQLLGDGEILGIENGKADDLTPYAARYRSTFRGRAVVYLRTGTVPGPLALYAYTETGLSTRVSFREAQNEA